VKDGERTLSLQQLTCGELCVPTTLTLESSSLRVHGVTVTALGSDIGVTTIEANPNLGAQIVEDAKEYVLYSWSTQDAINPIAVAGAEGRYFWDYDGKRYLDFASQLVNVNIGHQHPKIIAAIKEQADRLCTIGPPMASESRSRLGKLLEEVTPGDLCMSFFTNSGAEANENAIKLARLATGRHKIVASAKSCSGSARRDSSACCSRRCSRRPSAAVKPTWR
jgi:4-aminobutyrate aminotransferase-like enzyme